MRAALRTASAILWRDAKLAVSYRLNALLTVASLAFGVTLWFFLAKALEPRTGDWATGGYFAYVVTGTALMGYVQAALQTTGRRLRQEQMTGTLEMLLAAPAPPYLLVAASALWDLLAKTLEVAVVLALAAAFGLRFAVASWWALLAVMALTLVNFLALGILASGVLLVFQRGEPVTPFVGGLFTLLGGVFFPPEMLPSWLEGLSRLIPLPYALDAFRAVLQRGAGLRGVGGDLAVLAGFAAVLLPLSWISLAAGLGLAKRHGLLGRY